MYVSSVIVSVWDECGSVCTYTFTFVRVFSRRTCRAIASRAKDPFADRFARRQIEVGASVVGASASRRSTIVALERVGARIEVVAEYDAEDARKAFEFGVAGEARQGA